MFLVEVATASRRFLDWLSSGEGTRSEAAGLPGSTTTMLSRFGAMDDELMNQICSRGSVRIHEMAKHISI